VPAAVAAGPDPGERMAIGGRARTVAVLAVVGAVLAGCGSGSPVTPAGSASGAPGSAGPGRAAGPATGSGAGMSTATGSGAGMSTAVALDGEQPPTPAHPYTRYQVTGARSGVRAEVLVRLPAAYFDPGQAGRRFPVIETFHGMPGHAPQWLGKLRIGERLDELVAAGGISPAIIVSPDLNYPDQTDSECVDGGRAQLETWATTDVPDWVGRTFRARGDKDAWATVGLSAGGWCAAMATMLHPDRYRAAIVLSGYFRPQFAAGSAASAALSAAAVSRYDLVALAHRSPPPVAVWLLTSALDRASYPTSVALGTAKGPLAVTSQVLAGQDHSWTVWARAEPVALAWLARAAPGFAP
jgi:S-formylglutathione hydrolase FrmB